MSIDKQSMQHDKVRLSAGEEAVLWSQYQTDTMAICVLKHFLDKIEDKDIQLVLEYALDQAQKHVGIIKEIFVADNYPIPIAFTDEDICSKAPRLFSDVFSAIYLRHMSILGMTAGTLAVGMSARSDVSILFMDVVTGAVELHDKIRQLLLEKGLYTRPPAISSPDKVKFVNEKSFLGGFFGEKRSLTAIEITHIFFNTLTNAIGKALMMGFSQVAKSPDVKEFMLRGKEIATKHISLFGDLLTQEDLPTPMLCDANVTNSTTSPFSDKLMMFHVSAMISAGIGNYATAVAASQRRDIGLMYARLLPEISLYAEDGAKIMIDHHWMEEPPQADDRDELARGG